MGTLRRQLSEIGQLDLMPKVLDEVGRTRAELGYPIMVTPYSQFVGSQAVLNVLAVQQGNARWSRMPDEILRYVLGHFGNPPGDIDPAVRQRAADAPRTRELDKPLPEPSLDQVRATVTKSLGREVADGEVLLRTVLPADQLDRMQAAGPAPQWSADNSANVVSASDFVDACLDLPNWRSIDVDVDGQRVSLRRENPSQATPGDSA